MPRRVVPSSVRLQRGNTLLGLVLGILLGLGVAAAVALFVTKATVPFVNKAPRAATPVEPDGAKLPDPNRSTYAKDSGPAPVPTIPVEPTVIAPPPPNVAPGADGKAPVVDQSSPAPGITTLQAGAFSNVEDADSMRGRLALLGFESRVQPADREGGRIYRVRLGPYNRIEDLNRARQRLIENGVECTLVAPGK